MCQAGERLPTHCFISLRLSTIMFTQQPLYPCCQTRSRATTTLASVCGSSRYSYGATAAVFVPREPAGRHRSPLISTRRREYGDRLSRLGDLIWERPSARVFEVPSLRSLDPRNENKGRRKAQEVMEDKDRGATLGLSLFSIDCQWACLSCVYTAAACSMARGSDRTAWVAACSWSGLLHARPRPEFTASRPQAGTGIIPA